MISRIVGALAVLAALAGSASAGAWRTYVNERFGTTAEVPADWRAGEPPANGDGLAFTSPDGSATIIVSGGFNVWDSLDEAYAAYGAPGDGETITYHRRADGWLVVSGTVGDLIFYRKSVLSCRDQIWNDLSIEYPAEDKAAYDGLVAHAARSLHGSGNEELGDCD